MPTRCQPRRRFLQMLAQGGAVAGAASLGIGCGAGGGPAVVGNVSSLAVGSLQAVSSDAIVLGRDAQGVYAMSAICTHSGCDMSGGQGTVSASGIFCNCHGSAFDADGNVLQGPARSALEHYAVTIDGAGQITVDTSQVVAAATRTPVA